jgi:hypothetical protein
MKQSSTGTSKHRKNIFVVAYQRRYDEGGERLSSLFQASVRFFVAEKDPYELRPAERKN